MIIDKINTMDIFEQVAEMKWQESYQKGFEEGVEKCIKVLLTNTEFSISKIASLVGVSVAFVRKLSKEVRTK